MKHTRLTLLAASILAIAATSPSHAAPLKDKAYHFTIVHTNDHHGRFWKNNDGEYGLSAQKTVIDGIRADVKAHGGEVLVLSGGDINTGVPESDLQDAEPDFKGMSKIGFDAMTLGNHEFDNPLPVLAKQQKWANFPMLSANVYRGGRPMFEPYKIFNKDGLKIAVMGLTTDDTKKMVSPENLAYSDTWTSGRVVNPKSKAGLEFRSPIEVAGKLVPTLRKQADVVIAATHMGHYTNGNHGSNAPGDVEMARAVSGIDLIVGGHSQNPVCMKAENDRNDAYVPGGECKPDRQNGTWIVQAHEWGKYVGRADFTYKNGVLTLDKYALIPVNLKKTVKDAEGKSSKVLYTAEIPENPEMLALLKPFQDKGQQTLGVEIGSTLGLLDGDRTHVRAQPTNLGVMVAASMMQKVKADFAVMNSGGVRDSIQAGKITYKDVLKVQPFGNTLGYAQLSGKEVQDYLNAMAKMTPGSGAFPQFAGVRATFENGEARDIKIGNAPLDMNKTYRMAVNDFSAAGGDGYPKLKGVNPTYVNTGFIDAESLKAFIQRNSPIDASKYDPKDSIVRIGSVPTPTPAAK
ncbi:bifunctional UDP-sugar hydrolase/5'-nucleotidase UshA [Hydromonas duriensis]|uniref:5'-nucleotidase/UDP-sugar diphosphatase n=1 Tax=Hydromonas duriensis TaxID=1527608 RepID=A0A4R6Y8F0_9BURK|nr:bifunctional UDP-sugar hydrolase/5'-nucleotidase UshA [Hydromonas duriensis]TDR31658.1 5'-nucleotidase/UDP-sugar diphosphatase [Hydromonas duriensis]